MSAIDDYLKDVKPSYRKELERIRKIVKKQVPDAEETISYGVPTMKYKGTYLIYFAAFKNHMSILGPIEPVKDKLDKFKTSKGTIQFTEDNPVPEPIIKEIVTERMKIIDKK